MSPATPATGKQLANANMQTMGSFIASGSGSGSSSKVGPSPASTYGDSVATPGDGAPATPGDEYNHDGGLLGVTHLSLGDEKPVEVNTKPSGAYSIDITKYKNGKGYSPTTDRYSPSFVLQRLSSRDDPFMAQSPVKNNRSSSGSNKSKDKRALMSDDWRSGSSSSSSDKSEIFSTASYPNTQRQLPSVRDESLRISANNAQGYYLPAHCVFVANLLQSENEETLEAAVTQVFREFGLVFVKIRRDGKNMPFAFCQYTTQEDAERAIREGKGRHILGRPCRCEKAKAHRLFFIERNYGSPITVAEARELLTPYGELTECYAPSVAERTALNLNEGVMAHFKLFECGREAQSAFRDHELYRMQAVAKNKSPARQNSNTEAARAYVARYDVDRRSIFVGNLPEATTEMQLHALFSRHGTIENILLVENPSKIQGGAKYVFAFIEFTSPMCAQSAKEATNHLTFMGKTLKVTSKNSEHGSRNRLSLTTGTFQSRIIPAAPFHSPAPRQAEQHAPTVTHASPLTHMSPPTYGSPAGYGSPYGYPYSPYYSYGYNPEGQVAYYPAPYPSSYMAGSPGYPVRGSSDVGSTAPHPYYPYPVHAPYPTGQGNEQCASSPYRGYYYQPAMASSNVPEDRSPTPTPLGHGSTPETPMESE